MAVNVLTNLFMGGTRPNTSVPFMLPSADTGTLTTTGYADHQRRRSYQVVRQMRFSPLQPYGGLGNDALTDQKDWEWYQNIVTGGSNVAVDDVWNLIILPPNTRIEWMAAWVFTGVTGLTFDVQIVDTSGVQVGTDEISAIGATSQTNPTEVAITANVQSSTSLRFLALHFLTVPGTAGTAKLKNLNVAVQAEVVDWGSFDLNGNA